MKNRLFFRLLILAVVTVFAVTSCKDYDDDITKLQTEINSLKGDLTTQMSTLKTELMSAMDSKINPIKTDLDAAKAKLTTLESELNTLKANAATKDELAAVNQKIEDTKEEILSKTVSLEVFNAFKAEAEAEIEAIKTDLAKAATKEELNALDVKLTAEIATLKTSMDELGVKVASLETTLGDLKKKHDEDVNDLIGKIAALRGELLPKIETLEAVLQIENGQSKVLSDIYDKLEDQLQMIKDNKALIQKTKEELEAADKALDAKITALTSRVAKNESDITILKGDVADIKLKLKTLESEMSKVVSELQAMLPAFVNNLNDVFSGRLTSLVLKNDLFLNGVEAIRYNAIQYTCGKTTKFVTPKVLVYYHVNPSTVSEDMIKKDMIAFYTSMAESHFRASTGFTANAKFMDLSNGVLTVQFWLSTDDFKMLYNLQQNFINNGGVVGPGISEKFGQIALQVPHSDKAYATLPPTNNMNVIQLNGVDVPANSVVTSDYVRLWTDLIDEVFISRNGVVDYPGVHYNQMIGVDADGVRPWPNNTPNGYKGDTQGTAKGLRPGGANNPPNIRVIEVPIDTEVDLLDYVITTYKSNGAWTEFNMEQYDLEFGFDLKQNNGADISFKLDANDTDQQDFLNASSPDFSTKGTIKSKVYGLPDGTQTVAAINRTPIVRVKLMDTKTGCIVKSAFIKIKFTEGPPKVVEVPQKTITFNCAGSCVRLSVQEMNELVYNTAAVADHLTFRKLYNLDPNVYNAVNGTVDAALGNASEITDNTTGQVTYLPQWCIPAQTIIDDADGIVEGVLRYYTASGQQIWLKFSVKVNMPTINLYGHLATYWTDTNYDTFKVNPIVYNNNEANPTANIRTDLLNGFLDRLGRYTDVEEKIVTNNPADVRFEFDPAKIAQYSYTHDGVTYSVANRNLRLTNSNTILELRVAGTWEEAARIERRNITPDPTKPARNGYMIILNDIATETTAAPNSIALEAAKALVGEKAPIRVLADRCVGVNGTLEVVKQYDVFFIDPLKVNVNLQGEFIDAMINGSRVGVSTAFSFTDWNNYVVRQTAYTVAELNAMGIPAAERYLYNYAAELYEYYEVGTPQWNVANVKTSLKKIGGNLVHEDTYMNGRLPENVHIEYDAGTNELVYYNQGGTPVNSDYFVYIPVSVDHKWGTATQVVKIVVKPAAGVNP